MDAAFLAAAADRVLLSDDLYFRQLAERACGTRPGVWLQPVLNAGLRKGIIDRQEYADAIVGLAVCRHVHLALDEPTLTAVAQLDETEGLFKFSAVADFIGVSTAEITSHLSVVVTFLHFIWRAKMPDSRKAAASGIVIEKLLRHRQSDLSEIVTVLRQELSLNAQAGGYLERWLQGHFLLK